MSRHNYSDDCDDDLALGRWRGQVASSIRGKRGQRLLKELVEALDAMPEKRLITKELKCESGYCALGVVGAKRGLDLDNMDPEDSECVADAFDITEQLAREIVYLNDEEFYGTPEERWKKMRDWASSKINTGDTPV